MSAPGPLVSIVVPVYNVERFLPACLDSLLAQRYPALELLLVDDGSTDGSGALCDGYAARDARVRVMHQANGGLSRARNAGLAAARGAYVYFPDSDDLLRADAVERLVAAAEAHGADLVFFDGELVSEDGSEHPRREAHRRRHRYDAPLPGPEMLCRLVQNGEFMTPVPYLFLRRTFLETHRFAPDLIYEDVLFTFTAFLDAACAVYVPEALYVYRIRGGSIMTGRVTRRHYESLLTVYMQIESRLCDVSDDAVRAAILSELAVLQEAAVNLWWRVPLCDRPALAPRRRAFHRHIHAAAYAATPEGRAMFRPRYARSFGVYALNRYIPQGLRAWIKGLRRPV